MTDESVPTPEVEPEKEQTVAEWVEEYEKMVIEATGTGWFTDGHGVRDPDKSLYHATLVLVAIRMTGSIKDDVLKEATGLGVQKIQWVKSNMRKYGLLHSYQGCRTPSVELQNWEAEGLEGMMAFLMDAMVAAGKLARVKVETNGSEQESVQSVPVS